MSITYLKIMDKLQLILVFLFLTINSGAQVLDDFDMNRLDSLIIQENFEYLNGFFKQKDLAIKETDYSKQERAEYETIKGNYIRMIELVKGLYFASDTRQRLLIKQYIISEDFYADSLAGLSAAVFFKMFFKLANENNETEALKYYYLARNRRIIYIEKVKKRVYNDLTLAENLFYKGKFKKAYTIICSVEVAANKYNVFDKDRSKIQSLKKRILKKIPPERKYKKTKAKKEIGWRIYFGWRAIIYDQANKNTKWNFEYTGRYHEIADFDFICESKETSTNNTYGFSLDVNYNFTQWLQMGSFIELGKYSRSFVTKADEIEVSFFSIPINPIPGKKIKHDIQYSLIQLHMQYIFRRQSLLKPFVQIGYGYGWYKRSKFDIIASSIFDPIFTIKYHIESKENVSHHLVTQAGVEYKINHKSKVIFKISIPVFYYLKETELVGKYNIGILFQIGYIVWN